MVKFSHVLFSLFDHLQAVVEYALSNYGHVDILVNGAAGNFLSEAKRLSPKGFKTVMEIDAQGTYNMSYAIYSAMTKSGNGGVIINISMTLHYGGEVLLRIPASIALILWFHVKWLTMLFSMEMVHRT